MLMRFCLLLVCAAWCCGCAVNPARLNEVAADSLSYSRLEQQSHDKALAAAILQVTRSDAHLRIQKLLGGLPENITGCLVIEAANFPPDGDGPMVPAILVVFEGRNTAGYISNFDFDEWGQADEADSGWRAAAWPVEPGMALLPQRPEELIPMAASPSEERRTLALVTVVSREAVITLAGWTTAQTSPEGMIRERVPHRKGLLRPAGL